MGLKGIVTQNIVRGLAWRFFALLRMRKGKVEKRRGDRPPHLKNKLKKVYILSK
jgi:hypothetical protein